MVWCIDCGSDQPISGWQPRLFGHGPDLRGIVVHIFDDIVNKFHCYLLSADTIFPRRWIGDLYFSISQPVAQVVDQGVTRFIFGTKQAPKPLCTGTVIELKCPFSKLRTIETGDTRDKRVMMSWLVPKEDRLKQHAYDRVAA